MLARDRIDYPVLLFLGALDAAGYSLIAPVLPTIAAETGAGPAVAGALVASFPLGMVAGFALAGRVVTTVPGRSALALSLMVVGLGALGFVLGGGLTVYFPARFLMGLGSGGVWIGVTFGTLARWPGQEYLCMSRIFAAYALGGLIGPAMGALGGVRGPFLAYLGLVTVGAGVALAMGTPATRPTFGADKSALRLRGFWVAAAGIVFAVLALSVVEGVLPLHLATLLTQAQIGALYVGMSLVVALAAAATGSLRPRPALAGATVLVVAGLSVAGSVDAIPLWVLALALAGVGIGMANTSSLGVLLEAIPTTRILTAIIVWSQLGILGYLAGPLAGGAIAETLGFGALGLVPLVAGAPVFLLCRARPNASVT